MQTTLCSKDAASRQAGLGRAVVLLNGGQGYGRWDAGVVCLAWTWNERGMCDGAFEG